ncbi:MAG: hypothetical protein FWH27_16455, partial [Planctomycetaceae bacterium]|nr:hypothetical protein [Planctomycetaceae bacterium]
MMCYPVAERSNTNDAFLRIKNRKTTVRSPRPAARAEFLCQTPQIVVQVLLVFDNAVRVPLAAYRLD